MEKHMGQCEGVMCSTCGLSGTVSGGVDRGYHATTLTMYCKNCQQLADILIKDEIGISLEMDLHLGKTLSEILGADLICPSCGSSNLSLWKKGQRCPKCGGEFEPTGVIINWD
jgi:hypothetical protein